MSYMKEMMDEEPEEITNDIGKIRELDAHRDRVETYLYKRLNETKAEKKAKRVAIKDIQERQQWSDLNDIKKLVNKINKETPEDRGEDEEKELQYHKAKKEIMGKKRDNKSKGIFRAISLETW